MKNHINAAQAACLKLHANGDVSHFIDLETEEEFFEAVDECGDGLLRFLVVELADKEGADSVTEALNRVAVAIEELQAVRSALESHLDKLSDTHVRLTLKTRDGRTGQVLVGTDDDMEWDDADGDDETVSATFELFRLGKLGQVEIVEEFTIDGDQWRTLESNGSTETIKMQAHLGKALAQIVGLECSN